jgi:hypothetical protein
MQKIIIACAGFLLAVLWFDLMFDVQAWPLVQGDPMAAGGLDSIGAYYQRVTISAAPMNLLIGGVMLIALAAAALDIARGSTARWRRVATLVLLALPIILAQVKIFPDAQRLAGQADSLAVQQDLAAGILVAHLGCFVAIGLVLILQLIPDQR